MVMAPQSLSPTRSNNSIYITLAEHLLSQTRAFKFLVSENLQWNLNWKTQGTVCFFLRFRSTRGSIFAQETFYRICVRLNLVSLLRFQSLLCSFYKESIWYGVIILDRFFFFKIRLLGNKSEIPLGFVLNWLYCMGQSIQEWTMWNLRKTAFKKFEVTWSA